MALQQRTAPGSYCSCGLYLAKEHPLNLTTSSLKKGTWCSQKNSFCCRLHYRIASEVWSQAHSWSTIKMSFKLMNVVNLFIDLVSLVSIPDKYPEILHKYVLWRVISFTWPKKCWTILLLAYWQSTYPLSLDWKNKHYSPISCCSNYPACAQLPSVFF